jgi:hypothetical protein
VFEPLMSAFFSPQAFHFQTQLSDGKIVVVDYYTLNNNGFGRSTSSRSDPAAECAGVRVPGGQDKTRH